MFGRQALLHQEYEVLEQQPLHLRLLGTIILKHFSYIAGPGKCEREILSVKSARSQVLRSASTDLNSENLDVDPFGSMLFK